MPNLISLEWRIGGEFEGLVVKSEREMALSACIKNFRI